MTITEPTFPPLLKGHACSAPDSPVGMARAGLDQGRLGAGDVVWARDTRAMDVAIVLEPDVPLRKAVHMIPLAMVAAGDWIGALTPPKVSVTFRWPGTIVVNGGAAGSVEAIASTTDPAAVPDWIILRVFVRLSHGNEYEPGERPDVTALEEEGGDNLTRTDVVESYTRHFLTWLNTWSDDGFEPIHSAWLFRADCLNEETRLEVAGNTIEGVFLGLDEDGNMLVKSEDGTTQIARLDDMLVADPTVGARA